MNDDMETSMIVRLKAVSDYEFINRLQKMMNDIKISRDLNAKFKAVCGSEKIDINMMVLTSGPWPLVKGVDIILPAELAHCVDRFTAFYHSNCSGRKLNWVIGQSKGEIKTLYTTKPKSTTKLAYTFIASTFQIAILLCFNGGDNITIEDIMRMTGMEIKMLEAQLELLVKMKILTVKEDIYNVNLKYNYKKLKVKIDMPIKMETKAEADDTKKLVDADRGFMIDACVVRIMKSRNVMKHVELIDETIKQLSQRFKPDVKMIKKKIDSLIDREYMKRTEGKRNEYHYVA
jgi:cullin 1